MDFHRDARWRKEKEAFSEEKASNTYFLNFPTSHFTRKIAPASKATFSIDTATVVKILGNACSAGMLRLNATKKQGYTKVSLQSPRPVTA